MKQHTAMLIASVIAIVMVVVIIHAAPTQASGSSPSTQIPNKLQAIYATETAQAQIAATSPHATEPATPPTMRLSCPVTPVVGIVPVHMEADDFMHTYSFTNAVGFRASSGIYYDVLAGSLLANAKQGVLLVQRQNLDPCANRQGYPLAPYLVPGQQGALTVTATSGDAVEFGTSTGVSGSFNVLTALFS